MKRFCYERPLLFIALSLACGITLAGVFALPPILCWLALFILVLLCAIATGLGKSARLLSYACFAALGAALISFYLWRESRGLLISFEETDIYLWLASLRGGINSLIARLYPDGIAGIVSGLITGSRTGIPEGTLLAFERTGVAHILAVSGLHVGVVASAVTGLAKKLRLPSLVRLIAVGTLLFCYCALLSFSVSIVRASLMFFVILVSEHLRFVPDELSGLSLAFTAILLISPASLFDAGFLLSFSAVYGIFTLTDALSRAFFPGRRTPRALSGLFTSVGAGAGTSVVFASMFSVFYPLQFVTNLIAVPLASASLVLSLIAVALGAVWQPLSLPAAFVSSCFIYTLDWAMKLFSRLPFAVMEVRGLNAAGAVLALFTMFVLSRYCTLGAKAKAVLTTALLLLIFLSGYLPNTPS